MELEGSSPILFLVGYANGGPPGHLIVWRMEKKRATEVTLFIIAFQRLETAEATELAHVHLLNLNTGGNLEH